MNAWRLAALATWVMVTPAAAHHSLGMFDFRKQRVIIGAVAGFEWTNPHSALRVAVAEPGAPATTWTIELGPPGHLSRAGWTRTSLKPGDRVEVVFSPLRDGSSGGHLFKVRNLTQGRDYVEPFFIDPPARPVRP